MKSKFERYLIGTFAIIGGIVVVFLLTSFLYYSVPLLFKDRGTISQSESEIVSECSRYDSLNGKVACLQKNINSFYIYNLTDDKMELSLEDLKERGGDCKDWSELYVRLGERMGLEGNYYKFVPGGEDGKFSHALAFLSENEGFCIIDGKDIWCRKFK